MRKYKKFSLVKITGVALTATPLALASSLVLWALFALLGIFALDLAPAAGLLGGLAAVLLHWLAAVLHHLGHALAARRTGYPMRELRMLHVLIASIYPRDEPPLPAETHIQRALGGPIASLLSALAGAAVALLLRGGAGLGYLLALFFCLDSLLVFGLGALLPLGFTDGSTLLEWWPKRSRPS